MKITLKQLKTKEEIMRKLKKDYESLSLEKKITTDYGIKLGEKLNRSIKDYRLCKSLFFGGNN